MRGLFCPRSMTDKDITAHSQTAFTGWRNSYSLQSFPGSSDLESLALATFLWPPNASLLSCQKEVLTLREKEKTIRYVHVNLLKSLTRIESI